MSLLIQGPLANDKRRADFDTGHVPRTTCWWTKCSTGSTRYRARCS